MNGVCGGHDVEATRNVVMGRQCGSKFIFVFINSNIPKSCKLALVGASQPSKRLTARHVASRVLLGVGWEVGGHDSGQGQVKDSYVSPPGLLAF